MITIVYVSNNVDCRLDVSADMNVIVDKLGLCYVHDADNMLIAAFSPGNWRSLIKQENFIKVP